MFKRMSVVICGLAVMLATAGPAFAQGDAAADAATTAAVKTKLLGDTKVGGLAIDVDTKDNVVTLKGTVRSQAGRVKAVDLAKNTDGVKSIVDQLAVTTSD
jgi:osmotically-inducible protein OsmY